MKNVQIFIGLLFLSLSLLSGCDQAKDIATEAAEKAKQELVKGVKKTAQDGAKELNKVLGGENKESGEGQEEAAEKETGEKK